MTENIIEDILADLTSIVYSFCARLYGQRRAKRKTERIVQDLQAKAEETDSDTDTENAPEAPQEPQTSKNEHTNGTSPQQPVQQAPGPKRKGKGKTDATGGATHPEQERLPF